MPEEWGKVLLLSIYKWCLRIKGRCLRACSIKASILSLKLSLTFPLRLNVKPPSTAGSALILVRVTACLSVKLMLGFKGRSEERRVGKECTCRGRRDEEKKKGEENKT